MAEFDYMVFLAVAALISGLVAAFAGVIAAALVRGTDIPGPALPVARVEPAERYRPAA